MVEPTNIPQISLTEKEAKLFETLTQILKENNLKTILRVSGGWVRDKVRHYFTHSLADGY